MDSDILSTEACKQLIEWIQETKKRKREEKDMEIESVPMIMRASEVLICDRVQHVS